MTIAVVLLSMFVLILIFALIGIDPTDPISSMFKRSRRKK